jgi:hypothetical protein
MFTKLLALGLMAIIVMPGGAHLFELPAKMKLSENEYFSVQSIYAGWAWFSVAIFAAIAANAWLFWTMRESDPTAAHAAGASAVLIALTLVIFFIWVFPGNQATNNWTTVTADWESLRRNWEYGHAVNAVISFVALLATGRAIMGSISP